MGPLQKELIKYQTDHLGIAIHRNSTNRVMDFELAFDPMMQSAIYYLANYATNFACIGS